MADSSSIFAREPSPPALPLPPGVNLAPGALSLIASRSSGPGGQNVNKVNTRIELRLPLSAILGLSPEQFARLRTLLGRRLSGAGEIRLINQESRSQELNRRAVLEQLAALIAQAWNLPPRRRKTRPSRASLRRRIESKRRRSETKRNRCERPE